MRKKVFLIVFLLLGCSSKTETSTEQVKMPMDSLVVERGIPFDTFFVNNNHVLHFSSNGKSFTAQLNIGSEPFPVYDKLNSYKSVYVYEDSLISVIAGQTRHHLVLFVIKETLDSLHIEYKDSGDYEEIVCDREKKLIMLLRKPDNDSNGFVFQNIKFINYLTKNTYDTLVPFGNQCGIKPTFFVENDVRHNDSIYNCYIGITKKQLIKNKIFIKRHSK